MAISGQNLEQAQLLATRLDLTFPLLADPEARVLRAYGVLDEPNETAWPAVFIIDRAGRVGWAHLESSYKVRPAVVEILAALDAVEHSDAGGSSSRPDSP